MQLTAGLLHTYQQNQGGDSLITYYGICNDEITDKLIQVLESFMGVDAHFGKISGRVSFLVSECFQNVIRHGEGRSDGKVQVAHHQDFFRVRIRNGAVALASCNLVSVSKAKVLEQTIQEINTLNKEELKNRYTHILQEAEFNEKGGAGLGLIEMARKSGNPLLAGYRRFNDDFFQFFIGLQINSVGSSEPNSDTVESILHEYDQGLAEQLLLSYQGIFSGESNKALVQVFQKNLLTNQDNSLNAAKWIVNFIELIQNIALHAHLEHGVRKGILKIMSIDGHIEMICGNFIDSKDVDDFMGYLKRIMSMDRNELVNEYRKRMLDLQVDNYRKNGLGLLEILRNSEHAIDYAFENDANGAVFFTIHLKGFI